MQNPDLNACDMKQKRLYLEKKGASDGMKSTNSCLHEDATLRVLGTAGQLRAQDIHTAEAPQPLPAPAPAPGGQIPSGTLQSTPHNM